MADVAHDASDSASPKPGDIAAQQANRSDPPDRGKLRVFISYSRDGRQINDASASGTALAIPELRARPGRACPL
jgi:hypothetical protein